MYIGNLQGAILTALTADATLVSLTGHTGNDPRIMLGFPNIKLAVYPCLCYTELSLNSVVKDGPTGLNETLINFVAFSKTLPTVTDIISRLKTLFDSNGVTQVNSFLDFSNSYICNRFTIFKSIGECDHDSDLDIYFQNIVAKVIWSDNY